MKCPKKTKWRKHQKGRIKGIATRGATLERGECGLKAMSPVRLTARQIEAGRVVINRTLKRTGNLTIRVFPDLVVTKKPAEVRMGSGKGSPEFWAARVYPGTMLYELHGANLQQSEEALRKAGCKMPCRFKVVNRTKILALHAAQVHTEEEESNKSYIYG